MLWGKGKYTLSVFLQNRMQLFFFNPTMNLNTVPKCENALNISDNFLVKHICVMASDRKHNLSGLSCTTSQIISNNIIFLCVILHYCCSLYCCWRKQLLSASGCKGLCRRPWRDWADRDKEADKYQWEIVEQAVEKLMSFNPQTTAVNLKSGNLEEDWGGVLSITRDHR